MAYKFEAPFVSPREKPLRPQPEITEQKPKKKRKKKSRKESLRLENLVRADFQLRRNFDKEFPVNDHGEYLSYDIGTIVDRISYESRELKRLVHEQSGETTLDMFTPTPSSEDIALLAQIAERGTYSVARERALQKLGFYGEPWKWSVVFSVIAEETWRRRRMRAASKAQKVLKDAREAEQVHNLPLDD